MYRTIDIGQDQAENRENQRSRTDLSSKSRVKLNISLVKTLTMVADRPTVYVSVTPPCYSRRVCVATVRREVRQVLNHIMAGNGRIALGCHYVAKCDICIVS